MHRSSLITKKSAEILPQENEEPMNHESFHRSWDEFHFTNSSWMKIVVSVAELALPCVQCKCSH